MSAGEPPSRDPAPEEEGFVDRVLREYVRDPALLPVAIVSVLIAATFGASVLALALQARNPLGLAALALLIFLSVSAVAPEVRRRQLWPRTGLVLGLWLASGLLASALVHYGLF